MDILKSKTVTGAAGFSAVSSGGLSKAEIVAVHRQGIEMDYITPLSLSTSNRSWSMFGTVKRIFFRSDTPFAAGGEVIHIIYKVTT